MRPEMKRELLLALKAMIDDYDFEGQSFIAEPDTEDNWPRCAIQPPPEERNGFDYTQTVWVFLAPVSNWHGSLHLRLGQTENAGHYARQMVEAQTIVTELLGVDLPDTTSKGYTLGGPLTIHALHAAVKDELDKLKVA